MVDITQYADFFHDGSILDIDHMGKKMAITMESAEMDKEDIKDNISLSKEDRIKGKLHIEGIEKIKNNNLPYSDTLKMEYPDGEIFHFEIDKNKLELQIIWNSYPPKPTIEAFSSIQIEAKKIWWENIPDLEVE